ncbi:alpha-hydroxy-acid oxidizing protein, partial [Micromonospora sp. NPDC049799]|uniref:alpha-hydroxy-acid oxidizing protein n=1 Tax=Micromonospora sp. NPDC049799 TaxID=3154741 RepID=UPI003406DBAD
PVAVDATAPTGLPDGAFPPMLWALAAGGQVGAQTALALLAGEFSDALTLAGCADPAAARELRTIRVD